MRIGPRLECEDFDQHSKEDTKVRVINIGMKIGVQGTKIKKPQCRCEKKGHCLGHHPRVVVHRQGVVVHCQGLVVPPNRGLLQLEGEGAPDSNVCTALVTTIEWRCTDGGWRCHRPKILESSEGGLGHRPDHRPQGGSAPSR